MDATATVKLLRYDSLSDGAQEHAYELWRAKREQNIHYVPWDDETRASVNAVIEALGWTMTDWSIGGQGDYLTVRGHHDDLDLSGEDAVAYVTEYLPETDEGCAFTGYYMDDVASEHVLKAVKQGETIREAVESLAGVWSEAREADIEQMVSREEFENQQALFTEVWYLADGTEFDLPAGATVKEGE